MYGNKVYFENDGLLRKNRIENFQHNEEVHVYVIKSGHFFYSFFKSLVHGGLWIHVNKLPAYLQCQNIQTFL